MMDKKKLVQKLKTRANDVTLMSKSVKDFGSSVLLTCMAALFCSTVRPAFSSFTAGFSRTVNGLIITLPAPPILTQDGAKLEKDVKLAFSIITPTNTLAATVHLHNTTCRLHVQGSSPVSPKPGADTVAEWLTEHFIIPRVQQYMDTSKIDSARLAAINTAILDLPSQPNTVPTMGSSLASLAPPLMAGTNKTPASGSCVVCGGCQWGGRDPSICFPCGSFLHKKPDCRRGHRCDPRTPTTSSMPMRRAPGQDITSTDSPAFSSYRQPAALLGDIDSDEESLGAPLTPPPNWGGMTGSPGLLLSPSPHPDVLPPQGTVSVLANLLPHLQAPTLGVPPAPLLALPCPPPPPPPLPAAPARPKARKQPGCAGPALTVGGLEQELSQRAIIAIKEKLATTESSLKAEQDRSAILGQRVRLLESEVTRLLASLHLPSSTLQAEAPPIPPTPPCSSAQLLIPEMRRMSEQLASLQASVSAVLATSLTSPPPARELLPVAPLQAPANSPSPTHPRRLDSSGQQPGLETLQLEACQSGLKDQPSGLEAPQPPLPMIAEDICCLESQLTAALCLPAVKPIPPLMSLRPSPFHIASIQGPPPGPQSRAPKQARPPSQQPRQLRAPSRAPQLQVSQSPASQPMCPTPNSSRGLPLGHLITEVVKEALLSLPASLLNY